MNDYGFVPFNISIEDNVRPLEKLKTIPQKKDTRLNLHCDIKTRLLSFYNSKKIPHIIFHGPAGSGKLTIVMEFIHLIYGDDKAKINSNLMVVNCSHGKGIKFIREDLKFFAKTNIQTQSGCVFKTILLLNAHHLTIDAQSALRRCIEQFSYSTRFFIIVENKNKLLNPILSRFCDIYVPPLIENGRTINLHKLKSALPSTDHSTFIWETLSKTALPGGRDLSKTIPAGSECRSLNDSTLDMVDMVEKLYDAGVSCMDIVKNLRVKSSERGGDATFGKDSSIEMYYHQIKSEFRCEKMMMYAIISRVLG